MRKHTFEHSLTFAKKMDKEDELSQYKSCFHFPKHNNKNVIYLCGNSLGLQPKNTKNELLQELNDWATYGVEGHFQAVHPWFSYHHFFTQSLAKLVGAKSTEVVALNTLTVNLHLLLLSFYKPNKKRYKIIMEAGAFPSDQYTVETQVKLHDLNPQDAIIEIYPRKNNHAITEEDIYDAILKHNDEIALVLFGGVNYYTGQYFNIQKITEYAHKVGAVAGFDLAHAVGNVPLKLHHWKVDFACWCTYKYLNAGPGAVGGIFVNEKHVKSPDVFRLGGWWGHHEKERFKMQKGFKPMPTAQSWQLSNAQVFNMVAHKAALTYFDEIGMQKLRKKSIQLTHYTQYLLEQLTHLHFEIITPKDENARGSQLSLLFHKNGKVIFKYLQAHGIIADWREPNVIRIAPVPLYTSFYDVYRFVKVLRSFK